MFVSPFPLIIPRIPNLIKKWVRATKYKLASRRVKSLPTVRVRKSEGSNFADTSVSGYSGNAAVTQR